MIDGSAQGFEDNLRWTQRLAQRIHTEGLLVEAELGRLAGEEVPRATASLHVSLAIASLACQSSQ